MAENRIVYFCSLACDLDLTKYFTSLVIAVCNFSNSSIK